VKEFTRKYFELLNNEYKGINLTRINDYSEFELKQIKDSVAPTEQSEVFKNSIIKNMLVVDVGFGGGFPVLPLAFTYKEVKFIGVETRAKKVKVVGEISNKLGIKNVNLVHTRIENILIDLPCTITLKAVGKVADFLSKINANQQVQVFFYKGPNFYSLEKEQIDLALEGWDIIEEIEINLPGVDKRYLIGFQNKNLLSKSTNKQLKNLVKLSDLT
jgi:16S rRNA (guanine527-N7)-methyltransferase